MKKLFALLLAVLLLASCGAETANTESEAPSVTPSLPDGESSAEVSVPDTESVLSEESAPAEESTPGEESAPGEESNPGEESVPGEESNPGEEPTPDEDWPEPEVTGISFMDIRFSSAYRDVLDTYGEWESFRKVYLPEKDYETLYDETLFDTHKVLVLAWEEGYDANKIEFVSLDWDGEKAIASFRRRRPTGAVLDVCGIKLFLLAVPKEYPAADGDDLSVTVTDIGPYEELSKPMDILEEWTNLHVETGDERPADVTVLSTYKELQAFIARYAGGIDMGEYLPWYGELFFGDYRLAVVYCVDECGWESTRPKKLLLNPDGSLDILLRGKNPEDYGGDEPSEWLFFLWIPEKTGVDENTPIRLTVERVRLQDRIDEIYEPTREQFHAFVSQPGEDTFPWEGRKLTTAEDFIIPPTCSRWEEVAADFLCTKEGFTAYLAERGIAAKVEDVTYFMLMDDMPMIWLRTDKGQYFITSDFSRRDLYYTLWTEDKFCYRYMPKACKLYLNNKEMETSVPAVMYGKFAEVPLLEVLKKFGAELTWQSDTKASVVMNGESYTLDLEEITFRHDGEGYDLLLIPPGGYGTYYPVEGDLMMSYHLLGDLMQAMGTDCVVTANFEYPAIWIHPVKK